MGIGVPGSGKTTILKKISKKYGYFYICPDDIRLELTGDASNQSKNKEVWEKSYGLLRQSLAENKTVVFDATFTNTIAREKCLLIAREYGAKIHGVYLDLNIETAKERNKARDRVVPEFVLDRMGSSLKENPPRIEEGFDALFTLNERYELTEAIVPNREIKKFGKIR